MPFQVQHQTCIYYNEKKKKTLHYKLVQTVMRGKERTASKILNQRKRLQQMHHLVH